MLKKTAAAAVIRNIRILVHLITSPMILCSHLLAIPIQRAKHLVQENQALLAQPMTQNAVRSGERSTERVDQPDTFSPQHSGRGRGMGGKRGRGRRGHCNTPQSRRPTLLEMVRRYVRGKKERRQRHSSQL